MTVQMERSRMAETLPESVQERYQLVRERISRAASRAGRRAEDIVLVAVTKFAEPDQMRALIDLGHRDFGENMVQVLVQHAAMVEEYMSRLRVLQNSRKAGEKPADKPGAVDKVRWHMIGHLQRNKVRKCAEFVRLVHSVDSLRLAEELQTIALKRDQVFDVLVQVNCSGEKSKFGVPVPAAIPLAEQIDTMVNVRVRGLMTMAPISENAEDSRPVFARCRELFEELRTSGISRGHVDLLSMGMTNDYEVAVSEGANIVRVGTAIFGERKLDAEDGSSEG